MPASYYKAGGKRPEELYREALAADPRVSALMRNATSENKFQTTKDWSFLASRAQGENWFLVGEAVGFADPILAAGMSMAHAGGREVAYSILELNRGKLDADWIRTEYDRRQRHRVQSHIRFADYWYTANGQFTELVDFTSEIARDVGLDLDPEKAWQWLGTGGFIDEDLSIGTGGFSLTAVKRLGEVISDLRTESVLEKNNVFRLNLAGASWRERANYAEGRISREPCYVRNGKVLPLSAVFDFLVTILQREQALPGIMGAIGRAAQAYAHDPTFQANILNWVTQAMEAMVHDGWVEASYHSGLPLIPLRPSPYEAVHPNQDPPAGSARAAATPTG